MSLCEKHSKNFAFLLSDADQKFKKLRESTTEALQTKGKVLETAMSHRAPYMDAPTDGKSGAEINEPARKEIDALWTEIASILGVKVNELASA